MVEVKRKGAVNEEDLAALVSAQDFLDYFEVEYDSALVRTKHIQLMRSFNWILNGLPQPWRRFDYRKALRIAYNQLENGNELAFPSSGCASCSSDCDDGCDD